MPEPLRATSASDSPISPTTKMVWIGSSRLAAAASGLDADIADIERARSDGGDHVGAGIEFAPVDRRHPLRLLVYAVGLRHLGRLDHRLVADGDGQVVGLGRSEGKYDRQHGGGEEETASAEGHGFIVLSWF